MKRTKTHTKKNLECRSTLLPMRPLKTPSWRKQYTPNGTPGNSHCSGSKMKLPYATEKTAEIMGVRRNSHWKEFWKLRIGTELWHKPFTPIPAYLCSVCTLQENLLIADTKTRCAKYYTGRLNHTHCMYHCTYYTTHYTHSSLHSSP